MTADEVKNPRDTASLDALIGHDRSRSHLASAMTDLIRFKSNTITSCRVGVDEEEERSWCVWKGEREGEGGGEG